MFFGTCDQHEIFEIISDLESSKSSDLPIRVIKQSSIHLVPKLTKYFNEFIQKGVFPKILKTGRITPIHSKKVMHKYLGIIDQSVDCHYLAKFLKIIFLTGYKISFLQKALSMIISLDFKKKHSTNHAINFSINKILEGMNRNKHMLGIFIDLSKAFDAINHDKLLSNRRNLS